MQTPRRPSTERAYQEFRKELLKKPELLNSLDLTQETIIKEYQNWIIIKNRFPYDRMVRTNDMLVSKREIPEFDEANKEEKDEYFRILQELTDEGYYDALIENFPKSKTITKHMHIHLVRWHNTA